MSHRKKFPIEIQECLLISPSNDIVITFDT